MLFSRQPNSSMEERCDCITEVAGSSLVSVRAPCGSTEQRLLCKGRNEGANPSKALALVSEENVTDRPTTEDIETALRVLRFASWDVTHFDDLSEFKTLVAKISRQARQRSKQNSRRAVQEHDRHAKSVILEDRTKYADELETRATLLKPRRCYVCKSLYSELQGTYPLLCLGCARFNLQKRVQRCDLSGRVALVTGGRIKIGFELVLKLLRDGARVIVTTRFPEDAAARFAKQGDFTTWSGRLELHGLDLRHLGEVQRFIDSFLEREPQLDILVNNAAQTISRPLEFHDHLLEAELSDNSSSLVRSPMQFLRNLSQLSESSGHFPKGAFDADGQALDKRPVNSWVQKLQDVPTRDLLEVQFVNFFAPFMLCSQLKPVLERSPFERRFIVNVSAMEGQFSRASKGVYHPHTNAAKAALNMLTRTSGADYARSKIFMTAVDTGWITNENPFQKTTRMRENGFVPPLDAVDGAARIYDPIVCGITQSDTPQYGVFLKDYVPYPW
jgi:NAD(P)-dependent dehydrogenase (short-subunit alcohol dehydrogenase family)